MTTLPKMSFNRSGKTFEPIQVFQVNDSILLAVYKGKLSRFDILLRYRQKLKTGEWSNIRTPRHVHWTVDILFKMQAYKRLTKEFIKFFIEQWEQTVPLRSESERDNLNLEEILNLNKKEIEKFKSLSKKGEYSIRFLILLAKLLMLQEKTNRSDAFMFKKLLNSLHEGKDLFAILSRASFVGRR